MRLITGSLEQLQPLIDVSIGPYPSVVGARETYRALIDTGATRTCITQRIINRFGLQPKSKLLVGSATATPERRRAYSYSLGLFCTDAGEQNRTLYVLPDEFIAPWFQDNGNFDVLLGMDILVHGRFELDRQRFTFTFDF